MHTFHHPIDLPRGCTTECTAGCDQCPDLSTCTSSCDDGCTCNPGFYGSGKNCQTCPAGTFAANSGQSSCTPCNACSSGQYRIHCGGSSPGSCVDCQACPAGEQRVGCSNLNAGSCADCPTKYECTTRACMCVFVCVCVCVCVHIFLFLSVCVCLSLSLFLSPSPFFSLFLRL